jgi:DNA ligase (NAD+)
MDMIEKLVEAGEVRTVADLYRLDRDRVGDICGKGFARRALENLHAKKVLPFYLVIGSLNIYSFGRSLAQNVVRAGFDDVDKVLATTEADLLTVEKFGAGRAKMVRAGLTAMEPVIRDLMTVITLKAPVQKNTQGALAGKSVCITGSLSQPKKVFEQMIEAAGGEWHKSLKSNTTVLVAADPNGGSSKLKLARKRGTKIIGEAELMAMLAG